ncbi:PREDICTED: uncharacterized protein At3g27210-like isoform X1 [Camelina sativa]|uniref:Uncharacterized protein At3g27210-like isoform X1 n=2 Tax=Camelina sativa TaxID=90675 RepID=A0ABM0Y6T3_CAMSA|nr:PREDICTED: uncharacterized protein At3g27210-like isoform X1 [Camelina sativa]
MGSCVSSSSHHKSSSAASDSVVKLAAFISPLTTDVISSPTTIINVNAPPIHSARLDSPPPGDKEEMIFFDSRGWLDSDCEDDFMSVDGEFTPSRGTTPVHHKFCDQTSQGEEKTNEEEQSDPIDNKKRLLELFKETQDEDEEEEDDYVAEGKSRSCLWLRTPVRSSAPATPYYNNKERQLKLKRVRSAAHGGCVPRLVSCSSFTDRRRNMMTHAPH